MSLDGKVFMTSPAVGYPAYRISFEKNAWSTVKANFRESMYDVDPVTLGTDGTALIFGGSRGDEYDIYSFETDQTVTMNMPPALLVNATVLPKRLSYRAVWSEYLKRVVFYGDRDSHEYHDIVSFYHPESNQWSSMDTFRTLAITDDGKKLINFGGVDNKEDGVRVPSGELHILDLASGEWIEGAVSGFKRVYSACTIA
ncbi:hypothetical protein BGW42_004476, partial [Actinomortierella wolfii]